MDDYSFASVWDSSDPVVKAEPSTPAFIIPQEATIKAGDESLADDFDDDFDEPIAVTTAAQDDDDFGDFGDFEETTADTPRSAETTVNYSHWLPLCVDPLRSGIELRRDINEILGPTWVDEMPELMTDDDIRDVEGISQVLITPER